MLKQQQEPFSLNTNQEKEHANEATSVRSKKVPIFNDCIPLYKLDI